jgi:hypothetical protein
MQKHDRFAPPDAHVEDVAVASGATAPRLWEQVAAWLFCAYAALNVSSLLLIVVLQPTAITQAVATRRVPVLGLFSLMPWMLGTILLVLRRKAAVALIAVYLVFLVAYLATAPRPGAAPDRYLGVVVGALAWLFAIWMLVRGKLR